MSPRGTIQAGPYGGYGGSYYRAEHGDHKVKKIEAWGTSYEGWDVLGGFQFTWDDGVRGPLVGQKNVNLGREFEFHPNEKIDSMTVFAGDGEGFVNGFEFHTNENRNYQVGGTEGRVNVIRGRQLGTGELVGAEGRDPIHGASAVVDNMELFFKT